MDTGTGCRKCVAFGSNMAIRQQDSSQDGNKQTLGPAEGKASIIFKNKGIVHIKKPASAFIRTGSQSWGVIHRSG